jgi:hypothetical protein
MSNLIQSPSMFQFTQAERAELRRIERQLLPAHPHLVLEFGANEEVGCEWASFCFYNDTHVSPALFSVEKRDGRMHWMGPDGEPIEAPKVVTA